jgi:outer membrane lipoprotein-sorting protein
MTRMVNARANARALVALLPFALAGPITSPGAKAAAPAAQSALAPADEMIVQRIQTYLNNLHTLKAQFIQIAPNGAESRGTAWLERPGRMRFQYDPPTPFLLVAGHGLFVFHDSRLDQTTNIPLGQTPLGILLADHIELTGDGLEVTAVRQLPGEAQITLIRRSSPGEGSLTLTFSDNPLALRKWTVTDAQQQPTTVELYNVQLGGKFDSSLFTYVAPFVNFNR